MNIYDLNQTCILNISTNSQMAWLQNKYFCCDLEMKKRKYQRQFIKND